MSHIFQEVATGGVYKKGVLKKIAKFTVFCVGFAFFQKILDLMSVTLLKKETPAQVFSCEFCEFFESAFFAEHLRGIAFVSLTSSIHRILVSLQLNLADIYYGYNFLTIAFNQPPHWEARPQATQKNLLTFMQQTMETLSA